MGLMDAGEVLTRRRWIATSLLGILTIASTLGYLYPRRTREARLTPQPSARQQDTPASRARRRPAPADADDSSSVSGADCYLVFEADELFCSETAGALRAVIEAVEALDYVRPVFWLEEMPGLNVFGMPEPLLPPNDASPGRFQAAKARALQHPLVRGQLLADNARLMVVPIRFDWRFITSDDECSSGLLNTAREAARAHREAPLRIRLTGRVPLYLANQEALDRNQIRSHVLGYGLILVLAVVMFRGWVAVIVLASAPALGVYWTFGIRSLLTNDRNPLTVVVLPILISMVGLTDGVHLIVHIRRKRTEGMGLRDAAASAIREVGVACWLTSLTTAVGFASLMLAHTELVREFGQACVLGVILTFVAVVTFIPWASTLPWARTIHQGQQRDFVSGQLHRLDWLIDLICRRPGTISGIGVLSTVAFGMLALQLRPDDRLADSQPVGSPAYQTLRDCDRALGGLGLITVTIRWTPETDLSGPTILAAVRDVTRAIDSQPLVQHPRSIAQLVDFFPGDGDDRTRMTYLALLPEPIKRQYLRPDESTTQIQARIQDLGIATYLPVFEQLENELEGMRERYPGFEFVLDGGPIERGRRLYRIVVDLVYSLGAASLVILVVMTIAYRSLRIGLISLIPNLFPLVVTGAGLSLLGQPLDISTVCSFTVCLGIAVDDTIHYLTHYRRQRKHGHSPEVAVKRAFYGVGAALIMTTVVLVAGFATVLFSDMPGHRRFGGMACATIAAALVGDLVFLPAMLLYFRPAASKAGPRGGV